MAGVHYKGSDTFCCSSDAPCDEMKSVWGKLAQSDAPSAEPELFEHPNGSFSFRGSLVSLSEMEIAEAYAALRTAKMQHDNDGLSAVIEDYKEQNRKLMRELESLTPSGSEFVNDPEACVAYVKKARRSLHEIVKKAIIEKNELSAKVAQLERVESPDNG